MRRPHFWTAVVLLFTALKFSADAAEPKVLYAPDAQYTEAANRAHIRGTVRLGLIVGTDGCAHRIKVLAKLGYGLDRSAVAAVKFWKFRVARSPYTGASSSSRCH